MYNLSISFAPDFVNRLTPISRYFYFASFFAPFAAFVNNTAQNMQRGFRIGISDFILLTIDIRFSGLTA